jgi:hypothetical protein
LVLLVEGCSVVACVAVAGGKPCHQDLTHV